jgi:predicted Fe-Mo cluster-binding NifX family protein
MKIAVDSNDGINIASPFNLLRNFMVFEVDGNSEPFNPSVQSKNKNQLKHIRNISKTANIESDLTGCSTVISHCLNRLLLNNLQKSGVDIFITYQTRVDDALNQYLRDKRIHDFKRSN